MKNSVLLYNGIGSAYADSDNSPSMALMALSAHLKTRGFQARLLLNKHTDDDLRQFLGDALAVGFSVVTGSGISQSLRLAARIRRLNPDVALVWGGYHPTLETDQTLTSDLVDYVARGEGERTFEQLLTCLKNSDKAGLERIDGLSRKSQGRIAHNAPRVSSSLTAYPTLDFALYDHLYSKGGPLYYTSSRGCPFDCKFCCSSAFHATYGRKYESLPVERILGDLATAVSLYSPKKIVFFDDNFFTNSRRIAEFIEGYKQRGFKFEWDAFARCDFFARIEDNLLKGLKEINLIQINFGVESGSQRILDMVRKREKVNDFLVATEKLRKHGFVSDYTFINGFPGETSEDAFASVDLRNTIRRISPGSSARFFTFTPLPGTEMLDECVKLGYSKPATLEGWSDYEYHSFHAPWLKKSYVRFISNISWASFFDKFDSSSHSLPLRAIFFCLKLDARLRFALRFFSLAPEFRLIDYLYRRKLSRQSEADRTRGLPPRPAAQEDSAGCSRNPNNN